MAISAHIKSDKNVSSRVVADLKEIETVSVEYASNQFIKESLVSTTGDNFGSHGLGGCVENSSKAQSLC